MMSNWGLLHKYVVAVIHLGSVFPVNARFCLMSVLHIVVSGQLIDVELLRQLYVHGSSEFVCPGIHFVVFLFNLYDG